MGVLLARNEKGMAGGPAAKKVCPTREGDLLEQEEKKAEPRTPGIRGTHTGKRFQVPKT